MAVKNKAWGPEWAQQRLQYDPVKGFGKSAMRAWIVNFLTVVLQILKTSTIATHTASNSFAIDTQLNEMTK